MRTFFWLPASALSVLAIVPPAVARLEVNVTHVGFPSVQQGDVIRSGSWIPIIVDVTLANEATFDGLIRIAQPDSDGDECYDAVELHLRSEGGGTRRVFLYALANPARTQERFQVEVRSSAGEAVEVVSQGVLTFDATPAEKPDVIAEDDLLILSISSAAAGRIAELEGAELREKFMQPVHVAHLSPSDLPELWIGLDAVDYVVWDEAAPDELTPRQLEALIDWTRQGGTLLIAASRTAGTIKLNKALEPLLPVEIGDVVAAERLPEVRRALFDAPTTAPDIRSKDAGWETASFPAPVPVARCKRRGEALLVAKDSSVESDLIARGRLGRGHLLFSAVTLRDLFSIPGGVGKFFARVLELRGLDRADQVRANPSSLYSNVVSAVAFTTSGSLYLLTAAVLGMLYALAATFGSWKLLSARGWRHHSWSAFAAVGLIASALSLLGVGWMRGFGDRLHQLAIVDADAGSTYAHATVFFGVKTSLDKEMDFWLPGDWVSADKPVASPCFLRPLPEGNQSGEASGAFTDTEEYRLSPSAAMIDNVRIRATLKRFEGRWEGPLGGKVTGQISVRGRVLTDDSFIVNELGVDLINCYLLHPVLNASEIAGGRDQGIYAFSIGDLPSNGQKVLLTPLCYRSNGNETTTQIMTRCQLEKAQIEWSSHFKGLLSALTSGSRGGVSYAVGAEQAALLLLSSLGEFDPESLGDQTNTWGISDRLTWSRDRLRRLDLRDQLHAGRAGDFGESEPGAVILVGFSSSPGPMRLFARSGDRDFRPLQPEPGPSWSMVRIRIPTTRFAAVPEKPVDPYEPTLREKP